MLTEYRFNKTYNFMSCVPGETSADVYSTLKLIVELARTSMSSPYPFGVMNKFLALPNTKLFDIAVENGFQVPDGIHGWTLLDHQFTETKEEILRPWVTPQHLKLVEESNALISELNHHYTGEGADQTAIEGAIARIEALVEGGQRSGS